MDLILKSRINNYIIIILLIVLFGKVHAQPDQSSARQINGVEIFQDATIKNLFYYEPGNINIARNSDGKPEFKFIQTRYTGTSTGGDQGQFRFKSIE